MTAARKLRRCRRTPAASSHVRGVHALVGALARTGEHRAAETLLRAAAPARYQAAVALLVFAYRMTHD